MYLIILAGSRVPVKSLLMFLALVAGDGTDGYRCRSSQPTGWRGRAEALAADRDCGVRSDGRGSVSKHIYGVHDLGVWADLVQQAGITAWVVHTEAIGADPNDQSGKDYRHPYLTPIVRLNFGYGEGTGTIPTPDRYAAFAQRCANFVANSQGIAWVVIGNEIALRWEWPQAGTPLTLATYADCYRQCYDAIKRVNPSALVAPAAPAPWNTNVPDAPDWIMQLPSMLNMLSSRVDWICLHAYTRDYSLESFVTGARMDPPHAHRYAGWETLWEYMQVIPQAFRRLPVMVTEANGNGPWPANNTVWITTMYEQINNWNAQPGNQQIRAACLFRWLPDDRQWSLAHSPGAANDLRNAMRRGYQWREPEAPRPTTDFASGDWGKVVASSVNVRNAPSLQAEIALKLSAGATFPVEAVFSGDGLIWLQGPHGWVAEVAPDGTRLIVPTEAPAAAGLLAIMAASALFAPCVACVGGILASLAGAGLVLAKLTVALGAVAIIASLGTKSMEAPQWM